MCVWKCVCVSGEGGGTLTVAVAVAEVVVMVIRQRAGSKHGGWQQQAWDGIGRPSDSLRAQRRPPIGSRGISINFLFCCEAYKLFMSGWGCEGLQCPR